MAFYVSFTVTSLERRGGRSKCFLFVIKKGLNFPTLQSMPSPVVYSIAKRLKYFLPGPIIRVYTRSSKYASFQLSLANVFSVDRKAVCRMYRVGCIHKDNFY